MFFSSISTTYWNHCTSF